MMLEAAQRVRDGLSELICLVDSGGVSTADARRVLAESRAFAARVAVLQAGAAALVAAGERHGDRGAGVLAQTAGLSRSDAAGQVKTVEQLQSMPEVRDALQDGKISLTNARTLARASERTSAAQVAQDADLLDKAASLPPERFSQEASRWIVRREADGGEGQYRRQRARRRLNVTNGDDGMVHLRGELDPVTGTKLRKRLLMEAERLRRCDLNNPGADKRTLSQRLADALDTLTATGTGSGTKRAPSADVAIVQHLSPDGDKAFAEVAGGGAIPQSVLEEHFCTATIVGIVYSSKGVPLWRGPALPRPTKAQMDALVARYGGCPGCGEHQAVCQAHHIRPRSQGGPTDIDNLMLLCWGCHDKVHHHGWQVVPEGDLHTIAPPKRIHYGPARAPDPPPINGPPHTQGRRSPPGRRRGSAAVEDEPLFATV